MSSSNSCFLTCIQVSQEAGQVVRYSHLLKNFPQFIVIHTGKGFGIVNKAEIDVFLELSCFFNDPADVGNLTLPLAIPFAVNTFLPKILTLLTPLSPSFFVHMSPTLRFSLSISHFISHSLTVHNTVLSNILFISVFVC